MHEGQVGRRAGLVAECDQTELAVRRVQGALGNALDQGLRLAAVMDQVGNRADFQAMLLGKHQQVRQARHGAVVLHDFANHGSGRQAGHGRQVAAGFGVACAHQHAAFLRFQREDMARLDDIAGLRALGHGHLDGLGAVGGGNARRHAFGRFDGNSKIGAVGGAVARRHHRQVQLVATLFRQGQADQATRMRDHEIDGFRRHEIGGKHQIAFIFPVFFIDQYHHAAGA